ncbi:hypothetical protein COZ78_03265 [bacterium (Candidatus Gribaldobacteria) CG_4_8_14_3_um_filter_42_11]|uniref:Uncharacterized protein n=1 Tax=bacterium (Candidatus Gribaldobacteria) CG_4_8_14_3_um_filter_42_11 TaxID=2014267 RepID=A0A2M7IXJ2_9BACT|nr:MAG: hypothetical protein COZ78_03265 [bacterium (Candidatus Gribaldobacteria) CG_4_8_14_3_um_filter_42_11]
MALSYLRRFSREKADYLSLEKEIPLTGCAAVQFMVQWQEQKLLQRQLQNQSVNQLFKMPVESKIGWHYTVCGLLFVKMIYLN